MIRHGTWLWQWLEKWLKRTSGMSFSTLPCCGLHSYKVRMFMACSASLHTSLSDRCKAFLYWYKTMLNKEKRHSRSKKWHNDFWFQLYLNLHQQCNLGQATPTSVFLGTWGQQKMLAIKTKKTRHTTEATQQQHNLQESSSSKDTASNLTNCQLLPYSSISEGVPRLSSL